tara:strand:- start:929 stop:1135 length:207 start_codon:yes stop_codon:yes gene_type:complete
MNSRNYSDKLADHEDWKDGMNAFREKILKEITEIYQSIAEIKSLALKLAEYAEINTEIRKTEMTNDLK